jgi:predicted RNA methylase
VALAGDLVDDGGSEVDWRPLFQTGSDIEAEPDLSSSDSEEDAIYSGVEYEAPEPQAAPQQPEIEIVSPAGVRTRSVQ